MLGIPSPFTVGTVAVSSSQVVFPISTNNIVVSPHSIDSSKSVNSSHFLPFSVTLISNPSNNMAATDQVVCITSTIYAPLDFVRIQGQPCAFPTSDYKEKLPKFTGSNVVTIEDHLNTFHKYIDDLEIDHEDVTKMFAQTLEGDAQTWYKALLAHSIDGWESFQKLFTKKWAQKQDSSSRLDAFVSL